MDYNEWETITDLVVFDEDTYQSLLQKIKNDSENYLCATEELNNYTLDIVSDTTDSHGARSGELLARAHKNAMVQRRRRRKPHIMFSTNTNNTRPRTRSQNLSLD